MISVVDMDFMLHGPSLRSKRITAVLFGWFDDSSSHLQSKITTLCGFVGDRESWADFDVRWNAVLDKPCWPHRPKEFHMYECIRGEEFAGWRFAEKLALVGDLVGVLNESVGLFGIGCGVVNEIFSQISEADRELLKANGLGTSTHLLFQLCMQQIVHWTKINWNGEKVSFFLDNADASRALLYMDLYAHYFRSAQFGPYLGASGMGDSSENTPLQAADLLAYGTYQMAMDEKYPGVPHDFPVIPTFRRLINNSPAEGIAYDLESLQKLISRIHDSQTVI